MPSFLNRLFNIQGREWPRVLLLFFMAFIAVTGITWGKLTVQPLFWDVVGVDKLGYSFMVEGVLAVLLVALYTPFADRLANDRLLVLIALLSATAVAVGWILLELSYERTAYFLLYPLFTVIPFILNLHWWTYVTGFYDARAAKRIVPVLASNARLAGAFAGLSVTPLTQWLGGSTHVISLWALSLLVMAVLAWLTPVILRVSRHTAVAGTAVAGTAVPGQPLPSFQESIREGYTYVTRSPYLRWLAIATLLVTLLLTLLKFQSSAIIDAAFQVDNQMIERFSSPTSFLGQIEGMANLLMLPVQLFLLSRLIGRIGLNKANKIFPVGVTAVSLPLAVFSVLALSPALVVLSAFAYLSANVFNTSLRNPVDNLLYNAVPLRMKGRARAFVNGMLVPLAALIGGILVLLPFVANGWFIPALIGLVALVYVAAAWRVSRQYTNALVDMLEHEDYSFLLGQEAADLTVNDPTALASLQEKLEQSTNDEFTLFMVNLISDLGGSHAVPILAETAARSDTHIRAAILDIVAATDLRGTAVEDLYTTYLQDPQPVVRRSALAGLERSYGRDDKRYLAVAARALTDADLSVQTEALPTLLSFGDPAQREEAHTQLRALLASQDEAERAAAIQVVGRTDDPQYMLDITPYLADPSDMVRLAVALVVEDFSAHKMTQEMAAHLTDRMCTRLHDPVERVRQASLVSLSRTGTHDTYPLLVELLNDPSPQIRETAVATLAGLGKKVIPMVHPQLDSTDAQIRKMATVILGRINRREYGPLMTAQIQTNLLRIAENYGTIQALQPLTNYPSVQILCAVFQEENAILMDEIFFLLTAVQDGESVGLIRESLASEGERMRANALEALESLTSPQTARLIGPMSDPRAPVAAVLALAQETWEMQFPETSEAMSTLVTDLTVDPWTRSIATFALGEIGLAMITPEPPAEATTEKPAAAAEEKPVSSRRQRRRQADLLDALIDDGPEPEEAPTDDKAPDPTQRRRARRRRAVQASQLLDDLAADPEPETETETAVSDSPSAPVPDAMQTMYYPPPAIVKNFTITRVMGWLRSASLAPEEDVRQAAQRASEMIASNQRLPSLLPKERAVLSTIERIIFLKEVLFFRQMTVDQLKVLATVCEEAFYQEDQTIFKEGDPGGVLYVVVQGRIGIEREKQRGTVARLATIEAYSYFGEMNLFDESSHTNTAVALQDTLTLNLRREPVIALARQYPDLSLELINVLSQRLRETTDQVARLSKTHSRAMHKVFDQLE